MSGGEYLPSGQEWLEIKHRAAFDETVPIFESPLVESQEFEEGVELRHISLDATEDSAISRLGIAHVEVSYVNGSDYDAELMEPDVIDILVTSYDGNTMSYLLHRTVADDYDLNVGHMNEGEDDMTEHTADNRETIQYMLLLQAIKEQLGEYRAPVIELRRRNDS